MAVLNLTGGVVSDQLIPENIRAGITIGNVTGILPPMVVLKQTEYDALAQKDSETLYLVTA